MEAKKDLKATWFQALRALLLPVLIIVAFRWLVIEPFVIPSGSMLPGLRIYDHILVSKFAFGVRNPFGEGFLLYWSPPQKGDVVVFRYPNDPKVFYVKRLVGLPGDEIELKSGIVYINGQAISQVPCFEETPCESLEEGEEDDINVEYFQESLANQTVRYLYRDGTDWGPEKVPAGSYLMLGDNRNESADSRVWGFVKEDLLVGRVFLVWFSCSETFEANPLYCKPEKIRWNRIFKSVH